MTEPVSPPVARRPYRKPGMRTFGGLARITRMAVGKFGNPDGGGVIGMQRTGA